MLTVILTGGRSRRMGTDKALLPYGGETMAAYLARRYSVLGPVAAAGNFLIPGAQRLPDSYPGQGPLNGLYSAFTQTEAEVVFLTATDIPLGEPALVRALERRLGSHDACVIRRIGGQTEPTFALYRRSCLSAVTACLEAGERSFRALLERLDAVYVPEAELQGFDLARILQNVNTPDAYQQILLQEEKNMEHNAIFTRRSIRRFLEKPVEAEKVERLIRAGMQAPSGKNAQPWEFLVITDAEKRAAVSQMSEYAGCCRYAPVLIATMVNLDKTLPGEPWWIQDMAACMENMLLQAVEEGLGACWCGFYPREERVTKMKEYFSLPETILPFSVMALGYSERENTYIDRFDPTCVHYESWN